MDATKINAAEVNALQINAAQMNEGRKQAILIAATILAVRKLAQTEQPGPARESCIYNSIYMAEKIMMQIDHMWPELRCWAPGTKPESHYPFNLPEETKGAKENTGAKPDAKDVKDATPDANAGVKVNANAS